MSDFGAKKSDYSFVCSECSYDVPEFDFRLSLVLYGIIILYGPNDVLMGTLCPKCKKTSLNRYDHEYIKGIKYRLFYGTQSEALFKYHSFPYTHSYHEASLDIFLSPMISLNPNIGSVEECDVSDLLTDLNTQLFKSYCSYSWGDEAIGPRMTICWADEDKIESLVQLENETGLKVFPRYISYNALYPYIENFCWENHLILGSVEELSQYYRVFQLGLSAYKTLEKKKDFLNILTSDNNKAGIDGAKYIIYLGDRGDEEKSLEENIIDFKYDELWEKFCQSSVQESLAVLSDRFIYDYVSLTQRIDFNYGGMKSLIKKYFGQVYDSTKSSYQRKNIVGQPSEEEIKKVKEAEKIFQSVQIISNDSRINKIKTLLPSLAKSRDPLADILLCGETGTGKELFAKAIHAASGIDDSYKYIKVNCSSIPENLFESEMFGHKKGSFSGAIKDKIGHFQEANHGTIFLDEIGELSLTMQPRLLRVIQEREIQRVGSSDSEKMDVKMIFGTNRDLKQMVREDKFRKDLFMRIASFAFEIPPLRERVHDTKILVRYFIDKFDSLRNKNSELQPIIVSKDCMREIEVYKWEGNVRQLEKVIFRVLFIKRHNNNDRSEINSNEFNEALSYLRIDEDKSNSIQNPFKDKRKKIKDGRIIDDMLIKCKGNKADAARQLGVSTKTIYRHLEDSHS
jgi:DNA-binding NtrC family response regulator